MRPTMDCWLCWIALDTSVEASARVSSGISSISTGMYISGASSPRMACRNSRSAPSTGVSLAAALRYATISERCISPSISRVSACVSSQAQVFQGVSPASIAARFCRSTSLYSFASASISERCSSVNSAVSMPDKSFRRDLVFR